MKIDVKCKLAHPDAKLPTQAYVYDAGWDLYAIEDVFIPLGEVKEVKTGVHFEIPPGYVGIVFTRSSYGKAGKVVHHGVIDSGYRGELSVFVRNSTNFVYSSIHGLNICKGDKVAQIIFFKLPQVNLIQVETLSESERGEKGYGSSGR